MRQAIRAFSPGSPENVDKCPQPQIALIEKSERFVLFCLATLSTLRQSARVVSIRPRFPKTEAGATAIYAVAPVKKEAAALSSAANAFASTPLSGKEGLCRERRARRVPPRAGPKRAGTGPDARMRGGGPARPHGRTGLYFPASR